MYPTKTTKFGANEVEMKVPTDRYIRLSVVRDHSKTARSPMGGRGGGHQKSKNWTQKDTGERGGGVINF